MMYSQVVSSTLSREIRGPFPSRMPTEVFQRAGVPTMTQFAPFRRGGVFEPNGFSCAKVSGSEISSAQQLPGFYSTCIRPKKSWLLKSVVSF